jgi:hypothetical protein
MDAYAALEATLTFADETGDPVLLDETFAAMQTLVEDEMDAPEWDSGTVTFDPYL